MKSTTAFGAFVEIMPGTEGLLHISELQHGRTEKTEDVVKKGDLVKVKLIELDERGRMRLSLKALHPEGPKAMPRAGDADGAAAAAPVAIGRARDGRARGRRSRRRAADAVAERGRGASEAAVADGSARVAAEARGSDAPCCRTD